jgi:hypothetical protein
MGVDEIAARTSISQRASLREIDRSNLSVNAGVLHEPLELAAAHASKATVTACATRSSRATATARRLAAPHDAKRQHADESE